MVTDLAAYRAAKQRKPDDEADPTLHGKARCLACQHQWEAVAPIGIGCDNAPPLACPACECNKGVFVNFVDYGEQTFHCNCGNSFLTITKRGVFCPCCGSWVDPC